MLQVSRQFIKKYINLISSTKVYHVSLKDIYIHTYIYIHTHTNIHIYTHAYKHTHTHVHTYIPTTNEVTVMSKEDIYIIKSRRMTIRSYP